jgi:hypothetical protein
VVVGERTYELTRHIADYASPRDRRVKGIDTPVRTAVLRSVRSVPVGARPAAPEGPFLGRDGELATLRNELAAVSRTRQSRLVVVRGEAGQGKSRLVAELTRAEPDATVLIGRCPPYGDPLPLTPLAEAVAAFAGTSRLDPPTRRQTALAGLLDRLGLDPAHLLDQLDSAVLGASPVAGEDALWADVAAFRLVLEAVARTGPVVLVLEDLQWAAPTLHEALAAVAAQGWSGALLVVGTTRPEGSATPAATVVELDGLSSQDMSGLLRALVGGEPSELVEKELLTRAGGNPLYLEECVRLLVDRGALQVRAHAVVSQQADLDLIPQSMRMFIAARLDGLPADERAVLQDASVVGDVLWDSVVRELHGDGAGELLERVAQRGILRATSPSQVAGAVEYRFRHALLREVAYESMPRSRAERHRRAGDWFAQVAAEAGSVESVLGVLAHHYERAWTLAMSETTRTRPPCQLARLAVDHLLRWGRHQLDYQARTASAVLRRGLVIAQAAPECLTAETHAEVRVHLARGLTEQGVPAEAELLAQEGQAAATQADRRDLAALAVLVRAQALSDLARVDEARPLFAFAQAEAAAAGDRRGEAEALHQAVLNERYTALLSHAPSLRRAYELYADAGDGVGQRRVAQRLAYWLTVEGGDEFQRWFDTAAQHADDDRDLRSRAELARTRAFVEWYRGDHDSALAAARQAASHAADAGARWVEADALTCQVAALGLTGRVDDAELVYAQALDSPAFQNAVWFRAAIDLPGARAAARAGRAEVADARLASARATLLALGDRADKVDDADRDASAIYLERGSWAAAMPLAERGALACQEAGWHLYAVASRLVLARAALGAGRPDAEELLAAAVESAHRHGADGWGQLAAACLEQAQLLRGGAAATHLRASVGGGHEDAAVRAENDALRAGQDGAVDVAVAHLDTAVAEWAALGVTVWLARALAWRAALRGDEPADLASAEAVLGDLASPLRVADLPVPPRP